MTNSNDNNGELSLGFWLALLFFIGLSFVVGVGFQSFIKMLTPRSEKAALLWPMQGQEQLALYPVQEAHLITSL